ncbi:MAG TPA: methylaspartate mutase subunit S [Candidatus Riflebacteria bacterium]|jgi:methylaspartate mutase sigma subunit|nr:MAG: methylaspartate mutase subunit S [Candidatus Riflebacteria bacterium HGW-Riflebacteria-1]HAE38888.1 methylaspartate mutase subunit S [Candidatus Riflebacteria bacterium]
MTPVNIVLGVIGFDCHSVGNKILEAFFTEAGFKVTNLGVMVSQEEFISAAIETDARAILVSSLYGHGEIDCAGLREKCIEKGLEEILLYVGGNLVVGKTAFAEVEEKFLKMGYDRVFGPDCSLEKVVELLNEDLDSRPKGND